MFETIFSFWLSFKRLDLDIFRNLDCIFGGFGDLYAFERSERS